MSEEIRNVFVPHIHKDDEGIRKIKDLAARHGLTLRDSSITSDKPNNARSEEYIKRQILAPHIKWAGTLAVYVTPDTHKSPWVNWEIQYAHRAGKRIVGIWAWGAKGCAVPETLERYGHAMVGWNGENIVDAITGKSDPWYQQDGSLPERRDIPRHSCGRR